METRLVLVDGKNHEITEENPRNFKIGDMFYFSWGGMQDVQEVADDKVLAEVNGTTKERTDCIDFTYNFWRCVRKVIKH